MDDAVCGGINRSSTRCPIVYSWMTVVVQVSRSAGTRIMSIDYEGRASSIFEPRVACVAIPTKLLLTSFAIVGFYNVIVGVWGGHGMIKHGVNRSGQMCLSGQWETQKESVT